MSTYEMTNSNLWLNLKVYLHVKLISGVLYSEFSYSFVMSPIVIFLSGIPDEFYWVLMKPKIQDYPF